MADPVTLGLIAGGLGAVGGFFRARGQKKEAERREMLNRQLSGLDNAYAVLVNTPSAKIQEMDPGPGGLGGALSGGLSGFQGGAMLGQSLQKSNAYADMLKRLQGAAPTAGTVAKNVVGGPMSGMLS